MTSRLPNLLGGAALLAAFAFGFANVATAQTITVSGCSSFTTSAQNNAATINITCNTGAGGGATAPTCSNANIATVGATLTFSASCTQGTNPITSVNLNGVSLCSGAAACTSPFPINIPGLTIPVNTTHYTVTASDGSLQGSSTATYVVGGSGGGGGSVDLSACSALGYTDARWVDVDYPNGGNININYIFSTAKNAAGATNGIFTNKSALVLRFTTPALGRERRGVPQLPAEVRIQRLSSGDDRDGALPGADDQLEDAAGRQDDDQPDAGVCRPGRGRRCLPVFGTDVAPAHIRRSYVARAEHHVLHHAGQQGLTFTGPANTCTSSNCDMRWNFNN